VCPTLFSLIFRVIIIKKKREKSKNSEQKSYSNKEQRERREIGQKFPKIAPAQ